MLAPTVQGPTNRKESPCNLPEYRVQSIANEFLRSFAIFVNEGESPMIELQHLTKRFATQGGTVVALNDINLDRKSVV